MKNRIKAKMNTGDKIQSAKNLLKKQKGVINKMSQIQDMGRLIQTIWESL